MEKMGGRKFVLTLLMIGVGTVIEVVTERGLSATFAGFLGAILAAYSAANAVITNKAMSMSTESEVEAPNTGGDMQAQLEALDAKVSALEEPLIAIAQTSSNTLKLIQGAVTGRQAP